MKNEIKKIIISTENKKQVGITVVRENSIERYGYGKHSEEAQFDIYNKLYSEIKTKYKSELLGLTETQIANKLRSKLKVIEYSEEKLISNIIAHLDTDDAIDEFTIQYINGETETKTLNDFYDLEQIDVEYDMKLFKLCRMYGINVNSVDDINDDIIKKLESLKLIKMTNKKNKNRTETKKASSSKNKTTKKDIESSEVEKEKSSEVSDTTNDKSSSTVTTKARIKNFVMNHKVLSGVLLAGTVILVTTIPGCSKKNNKNVIDFSNIKPVIDETDESMEFVFDNSANESVMLIDEIPTFEPIEFFKEIYINGEEKLFENYNEPESNTLVMRDIDGAEYYLDNQFFADNSFEFNMKYLGAIRNETMSNISNYVQGGFDIGDTGRYIYFENMFNDFDNKDKAYVKYFSMMGNAIIKSVYEENSLDNLKKYLKLSGFEAIRLIRDDEPLCVYINGNEEWVSFSDLSYDAQEAVLNIAWTNNLPLYESIISYGDYEYNQDYISITILEKYQDLQNIKRLGLTK